MDLPLSDIRFSQDSIGRRFSDGGTVYGLARRLSRENWYVHTVPPIRVVLDDQSGEYVSLDNRRLYAMYEGLGENFSVCVEVCNDFESIGELDWKLGDQAPYQFHEVRVRGQ